MEALQEIKTTDKFDAKNHNSNHAASKYNNQHVRKAIINQFYNKLHIKYNQGAICTLFTVDCYAKSD